MDFRVSLISFILVWGSEGSVLSSFPCDEVTHSLCAHDEDHIILETRLADKEACHLLCQAFFDKCHFFIFEEEALVANCILYDENFSHYISKCNVLAGPKNGSDGCNYINPQDNSCQVFRGGKCDYGVPEETEIISSWESCQALCQATSYCHYWKFHQEEELCLILYNASPSCKWDFSPREPEFIECRDGITTTTTATTFDNETTTTSISTTTDTTTTTTATKLPPKLVKLTIEDNGILNVTGYSLVDMMLVGGGGGTYHAGGGGSGYVETFHNIYIPALTLEVLVGDAGDGQQNGFPTIVKIVDYEFRAQGGRYGHSDGGNGYSGGGGSAIPAGDGGEDGGDGKRGSIGKGGLGSGFDLSTVSIEGLQVLPGYRGTGKSNAGYGGGGGGVLVSGLLSPRCPVGGPCPEVGEGFGGGNGAYHHAISTIHKGRPGVAALLLHN